MEAEVVEGFPELGLVRLALPPAQFALHKVVGEEQLLSPGQHLGPQQGQVLLQGLCCDLDNVLVQCHAQNAFPVRLLEHAPACRTPSACPSHAMACKITLRELLAE